MNFSGIKGLLELVPYRNGLLIFTLLIIITLIVSLLVPTLKGTYDYSFLVELSIMGKAFLLGILVAYVLHSYYNEAALDKYLEWYCIACSLYVLVSALMLLVPEVRDFWFSFTYLGERGSQVYAASYVSRYGWSGFSGWSFTVYMTICVVFGLFLFCVGKNTGILYVLLGLMGNLFYGRSGLVLSLLVVVYFALKNLSLKWLKVTFVLGILLVCFIYFISQSYDPRFEAYWLWLSSPVEAFFAGIGQGNFSLGSSADYLMYNMYFMPDDDWTVLLGDGFFTATDGSYYMYTDAGYMRSVLYFGILGSMPMYLSFLLIVYVTRQALKKHRYGTQCNVYILADVFLFAFFLFEYKAPVIGFLYMGMFPVFLLSASEQCK